MKKLILVMGITFVLFSMNAFDSSAKRRSPNTYGFFPSIVVDKAGTANEIDVNAAPFFAMFTINKYYDLRLSTKAMYHFGSMNRWANIGGELAFPIYFNPKYSDFAASKGAYTAPFIAGFNNKYKHYQSGIIGIEPGYLFLFRNKYALSAGIQIGAEYVNHELQDNAIYSHFELKLCFGFWM